MLSSSDLSRAERTSAASSSVSTANTNPNKGILTFNGVSVFYAMFYSYDKGGSTPIGAVSLLGNSTYHGGIIVNSLSGSGSSTIIFPSNPGISIGEGLLYYGWNGGWQEYNPVRGDGN